jgi:hypothetical protein
MKNLLRLLLSHSRSVGEKVGIRGDINLLLSLPPSDGERVGVRGQLFQNRASACNQQPKLYPLRRGRVGCALLLALSLWLVATSALSATISESFVTNPLTHGWRVFGDANLFQWNAVAQNLGVTWDSSRSNSYFYVPLGTILNRHDPFSVTFDLQLTDLAAGINPAKPSTFPLGIGFLNLLNATAPGFFRGSSFASPNLVEFSFFPDTGFGPTVWPSIWSTNSVLNYHGGGDYAILDLPLNVGMRITMTFSNSTLSTAITTNGVAIGAIPAVTLTGSFTDFRVGAFAIESYNDSGQHPQYGGSLLGHGTVDNIAIVVPPPPVQELAGRILNNRWQVTFLSRTNWNYVLENSTNLLSWTPVTAAVSGNADELVLQDTNTLAARAFYRVNAYKP